MSKKTAIILIIILILLNLGMGYVIYRAKASADSIVSAANSATSQNASLFGFNKNQLPATDVTGVDLPGIPRYQYLVRTKYQKTDSGITITEYQTKAAASFVLAYYKTALAKADWVLDYSDNTSVIYLKNNQKITLSTRTNNGVTTLSITY